MSLTEISKDHLRKTLLEKQFFKQLSARRGREAFKKYVNLIYIINECCKKKTMERLWIVQSYLPGIHTLKERALSFNFF